MSTASCPGHCWHPDALHGSLVCCRCGQSEVDQHGPYHPGRRGGFERAGEIAKRVIQEIEDRERPIRKVR